MRAKGDRLLGPEIDEIIVSGIASAGDQDHPLLVGPVAAPETNLAPLEGGLHAFPLRLERLIQEVGVLEEAFEAKSFEQKGRAAMDHRRLDALHQRRRRLAGGEIILPNARQGSVLVVRDEDSVGGSAQPKHTASADFRFAFRHHCRVAQSLQDFPLLAVIAELHAGGDIALSGQNEITLVLARLRKDGPREGVEILADQKTFALEVAVESPVLADDEFRQIRHEITVRGHLGGGPGLQIDQVEEVGFPDVVRPGVQGAVRIDKQMLVIGPLRSPDPIVQLNGFDDALVAVETSKNDDFLLALVQERRESIAGRRKHEAICAGQSSVCGNGQQDALAGRRNGDLRHGVGSVRCAGRGC